MIKNTRQNWQIGSTVKVGFLTLRVIGAKETPGDYRPDIYLLENLKGTARYEFTPHCGLQKI